MVRQHTITANLPQDSEWGKGVLRNALGQANYFLSPLMLNAEIVVWIYDTFANNFEIKYYFTKYFANYALARKISSKLSGWVNAT